MIYVIVGLFLSVCASCYALPDNMEKVMQQEKYRHAIWGLFVKDLQTGAILFEHNADKFFAPASTTKIFSVTALLHTFGPNYRFKTPVYAKGKIDNGLLQGNLILVAQGDLTMGGRQQGDRISFTKMDHTIANFAPGALLTKEDPLQGLNALAREVAASGIKEVQGDVIIDDSLFETFDKRDILLSPIMINENQIDIVITPSELTWRPQIPGYTVTNRVKTVDKGELKLDVTADPTGRNIIVEGTIPASEDDVVRTFAIQDPKAFAKAAFIQALQKAGVKVAGNKLDPKGDNKQVALFTSPPLSEYAKLILKVSHNMGANIIPLLLSSRTDEKTYEKGLRLLGDFAIDTVGLAPQEFVFLDAAGGNDNRLTPQGQIKLLEYARNDKSFYDALPILGVDGSLEDFARETPAAGKVRAKPGTGVVYNAATGKFFLITQGFAGYIEGKKGLYAYIVIVNNADMSKMEDAFGFFKDEAELSSILYNLINTYPFNY